jgi:hypothetical protein
MHPICLSINTGRCGTTFLASALSATYPEAACYHESVRDDVTNPRDYLWRFDEADFEGMRADPAVGAFLDRIADESRDRPFIDPGNNLSPLVPLIAATFPGRVRVLHLVRDPVLVAASFVNFTMYAEGTEHPERPGGWWNNSRPPNPRESRCAHPEYADRWDRMTPFEKNLWRWAEYNLYALEFHRRFPDVPFQTVVARQMFKQPAESLARVIDFYGLPTRAPILPPPDRQNAANPNLRHSFPVGPEWRRYEQYAYILDLARELGDACRPEEIAAKVPAYAAPTRWELFRYRLRYRLKPRFWAEKLARPMSRPEADPPRPQPHPIRAASPVIGGTRPDPAGSNPTQSEISEVPR